MDSTSQELVKLILVALNLFRNLHRNILKARAENTSHKKHMNGSIAPAFIFLDQQ